MVSLLRAAFIVLPLFLGSGTLAIAAEVDKGMGDENAPSDGETAPYRAVSPPAPIYDEPVFEPSMLGGEYDTPEQRQYEQRARDYEEQRRRRLDRERGGFKGLPDWLD